MVNGTYVFTDTLRQHFFQLKEKSKHNTIHLKNRKCPSCQFTEHLIPKDITHQLFQQKVLTDDELKAMNNDKIPVKERNFMLLDILRTHVKPRESITILKATLSRKYAHLLETLGSCSSTRDLPSLCTCLDQDTTEDDEPSPLRTATSCDEQPNNKVVLFESVQKLSLENNSESENLWESVGEIFWSAGARWLGKASAIIWYFLQKVFRQRRHSGDALQSTTVYLHILFNWHGESKPNLW